MQKLMLPSCRPKVDVAREEIVEAAFRPAKNQLFDENITINFVGEVEKSLVEDSTSSSLVSNCLSGLSTFLVSRFRL